MITAQQFKERKAQYVGRRLPTVGESVIEAGVVIDVLGNPIYWHLPEGRSGGSLPDGPELWDVLWKASQTFKTFSCAPGALLGFAHSHPGKGTPFPSYEDLSTFDAVERALGRRLRWWIVSEDGFVVCTRETFTDGAPFAIVGGTDFNAQREIKPFRCYLMEGSHPSWVYELRKRSNY